MVSGLLLDLDRMERILHQTMSLSLCGLLYQSDSDTANSCKFRSVRELDSQNKAATAVGTTTTVDEDMFRVVVRNSTEAMNGEAESSATYPPP